MLITRVVVSLGFLFFTVAAAADQLKGRSRSLLIRQACQSGMGSATRAAFPPPENVVV